MPATIVTAYLAEVAGMAATIRPYFDRERWTTCCISSLDIGHVFALPGDGDPLRPVVLASARAEESPGETYGWVIGEANYIDTGEPASEFKLRANRSVLTRCDLRYAPRGEQAPTES